MVNGEIRPFSQQRTADHRIFPVVYFFLAALALCRVQNNEEGEEINNFTCFAQSHPCGAFEYVESVTFPYFPPKEAALFCSQPLHYEMGRGAHKAQGRARFITYKDILINALLTLLKKVE